MRRFRSVFAAVWEWRTFWLQLGATHPSFLGFIA